MAVLSARMGLRHFPSVYGAFRYPEFLVLEIRQLSPLGAGGHRPAVGMLRWGL